MSSSRKKLQEAMFEIITSEASYYKSLSVLDKVFVNSSLLKDESVLSKNDWKILFGNVGAGKLDSNIELITQNIRIFLNFFHYLRK